jgi:transcriptional regulator with XRE-family HTH domain
MNAFGHHIRRTRERLRQKDRRYSLRQVAERIGVEPSYLSKVERGEVSPPSEQTILRLAEDIEQDGDTLLALAGKVSSDLQDVIRKRPEVFAKVIRELRDVPDHAVLEVVRVVRDGDW